MNDKMMVESIFTECRKLKEYGKNQEKMAIVTVLFVRYMD